MHGEQIHLRLPSRTLGGGHWTTNSGGVERAQRAHAPDGLKMNSVLMENSEMKIFWKLLESGERRARTAADMVFFKRLRFALMEHASQPEEATERRCGRCGVWESRCCCPVNQK